MSNDAGGKTLAASGDAVTLTLPHERLSFRGTLSNRGKMMFMRRSSRHRSALAPTAAEARG
jgi:hypothetical protein